MSPQNVLPFKLEEEPQPDLTRFAGLPLLAETFRALGLDRDCNQRLGSLKERDRGLAAAELVESFLLLLAAGGEHLADFEALRHDEVLAKLLGYHFPAPSTAWDFLMRFDDFSLAEPQNFVGAFIPLESALLTQLALVNRNLVRRTAAQRAEVTTATLDLDAKIIASHKQQAKATYLGYSGYQPLTILWAELELLVGDEFRDGNVPAGHQITRLYHQARRRLPKHLKRVRLRSDSAAYQHEFLAALVADGVQFTISADMSPELRACCVSLPEQDWQPLDEDRHAVRCWAEVPFVPTVPNYRSHQPPDRYLAYRVVPKQGELFADGAQVKYFAVVTNMDWRGDRLLRWHWEKAGTIEHVHHLLASELGAGVMPSKHFAADAAYFRLNVLCHNLLQATKLLALPEEHRYDRPKRLRFLLFGLAGRLVSHARTLILRIAQGGPSFALYRLARERLALLAATTARAIV
jgi:hypothetical protein